MNVQVELFFIAYNILWTTPGRWKSRTFGTLPAGQIYPMLTGEASKHFCQGVCVESQSLLSCSPVLPLGPSWFMTYLLYQDTSQKPPGAPLHENLTRLCAHRVNRRFSASWLVRSWSSHADCHEVKAASSQANFEVKANRRAIGKIWIRIS